MCQNPGFSQPGRGDRAPPDCLFLIKRGRGGWEYGEFSEWRQKGCGNLGMWQELGQTGKMTLSGTNRFKWLRFTSGARPGVNHGRRWWYDGFLYVPFPLQRKSHFIPEQRKRRVTRLPRFQREAFISPLFLSFFLIALRSGVLCCGNEVETEAWVLYYRSKQAPLPTVPVHHLFLLFYSLHRTLHFFGDVGFESVYVKGRIGSLSAG